MAEIENPTWLGHIRHFFEKEDIEHMNELGIDLATYKGVKARATNIYFLTKPPHASMPPDKKRMWDEAKSETFRKWIEADFPLGTPLPVTNALVPSSTASRIRKDILSLDDGELEKLKTAFEGILTRPPTDPNSYFVQAGTHWYPEPLECLHHENRYNPWHRAFLQSFEDALRSIQGCEDVTLPYWDITGPVPQVLFKPPFAQYTCPTQYIKTTL